MGLAEVRIHFLKNIKNIFQFKKSLIEFLFKF